jgi:hypothetical protein
MNQPFSLPNRIFLPLLLLVLVAGAVVHLIGYDRGLPLYESKDERRNIHEVWALRGLTDMELWKPGYPPGILYVNHAAQLVAEQITGRPATECACETVRTLRLTGIAVNLLAAVGLALLARWLAGPIAGLVVPLAWLLNPDVLSETQYAFPQTYEHIGFVAAVGFAALALERRRPAYLVASTVAALLAIVFKYTLFPLLAIPFGAGLWLLIQRDSAQRRLMLSLTVAAVLVVACAGWLLLGYDALRLVTETEHVETENVVSFGGFANLTDRDVWGLRLGTLTAQGGLSSWVFGLVVLVGTPLYWRRATAHQCLVLAGIISMIVVHVLTLTVMLLWHNAGLRQNLTISGLTTIWVALSLVAMARAYTERLVSGWWATPALTSLLLMMWAGPLGAGAITYALERRLPVTYGAVPAWAGTMLPFNQETGLLVSDLRPFQASWNCYPGPHIPNPQDGDYTDPTLADWQSRDNIAFTQLNEEQVAALTEAEREALTLIARFPGDDTLNVRTWRRGDVPVGLAVYHTLPVVTEVSEAFGSELQLSSYTMPDQVAAGDALVIWLYWQPTATVTADYAAFLHLTPPDDPSNLIAQGDGPLNDNPFAPTTAWTEPDRMVEQVLFPGRFVLHVPEATPPGDYVLRLGVYNRATGVRLPLADGAEALEIPVAVVGESVQAAR